MTTTSEKNYYQTIDILRLVLAFFICVKALGFPTILGSYLQAFSTFAIPAFYILSGFLTLQEDEDFEPRLLRSIKRNGITFLALVLAYALCSVLLQPLLGAPVLAGINPFFSKSAVYDFIVFNNWPLFIGGNIWFLQGLVYAYIIIYLLHRFHLMKLEIVLLPLLLVLSFGCGEFAGVLNIHPLGQTYISSNFLTSALPYLLLGRLLNSKRSLLEKAHRIVFPLAALAGVLVFGLEVYLLQYTEKLMTTGQFVGSTITAVGLCCICFRLPTTPGFVGNVNPGGRIAKAVYWFHNPMGTLMRVVLLRSSILTFIQLTDYLGLLTFGIILIAAFFRENIVDIQGLLLRLKPVEKDPTLAAKKTIPMAERIQGVKDWFQYQKDSVADQFQMRQYRQEEREAAAEAREQEAEYRREQARLYRQYRIQQFLDRFRRK